MNRKPYNIRMDLDLIAAMRRVKARDGIPESEQIRRALRAWLKEKGITTGKRGRA